MTEIINVQNLRFYFPLKKNVDEKILAAVSLYPDQSELTQTAFFLTRILGFLVANIKSTLEPSISGLFIVVFGLRLYFNFSNKFKTYVIPDIEFFAELLVSDSNITICFSKIVELVPGRIYPTSYLAVNGYTATEILQLIFKAST